MEIKSLKNNNSDKSDDNTIQDSGKYLKETKETNYYSSNRKKGNDGAIIMYISGLLLLCLFLFSIINLDDYTIQLFLFVSAVSCLYLGLLFSRGPKLPSY